jgi:uncharacterized protein YeaO (DUF488 family)
VVRRKEKIMIEVKRAYEEPQKKDGLRILVDRMWPRGVKKEKAAIDEWTKDIAPSSKLRKWFSHDPEKWQEFKRRYFKELKEKNDLVKRIKEKAKDQTITLIHSAKDVKYNNAVALKEYIEEKI